MLSAYYKNLKPHIDAELALGQAAKDGGEALVEFHHLENAHVIGQESTYWHVKIHCLMLLWAIRNKSFQEIIGQIFRILGAATKTAPGLVPQGNTGGANVSPFKAMAISPEHTKIIQDAKARVHD